MHYSLAPARSTAHAKLLECLAQCFEEEGGFNKDTGRLRSRVSPACSD
jgi:hypothetical protein